VSGWTRSHELRWKATADESRAASGIVLGGLEDGGETNVDRHTVRGVSLAEEGFLDLHQRLGVIAGRD
jgi:hypothetical protein